jgi:hypothetical protein
LFLLGLAGFVCLAATPAAASEKLPPIKPFRTDIPPLIDGVLDDPVWKHAPTETGFKTWTPDFGKDMAEKTVVSYAYDRENLYFAYRCYDREPSKIKATLAARDTIQRDDWVCLNLDSFNDAQSLYAFYVNPLGIQGDSRLEGALENEDYTVDVVWYSAGKIDAEGYAVEIKLPFKSIRYRRKEPVEMGIIFERRVSRQSEQGTYPPLDPAQGPNFLTQMRPLHFSEIKHYTLFEALPAATYGRQSTLDEGELQAEKPNADLSLTAKYGLTSQLILDGTANPDFSQVESDAGQVDFNLRYALFYPEKRPFFLEGREKFTFAANQSADPLDAIVHTRTIVDPLLAFKLNGKLSSKDTVASIYALDELPEGGPEDYAHFAIVRYKRALQQDSYWGAFMTGRFQGPHYNAVAGSDGQIRLAPSSLASYHLFTSFTKAGEGAEVGEGTALGLQYDFITRDWILNFSVKDLSKDFETETGYLTRNGLTRLRAGAVRMLYPKSKLVLRIDPIVQAVQTRDKFADLWETYDSLDVRLIFPRNTTLTLGGRYATEIYSGNRFGRTSVRLVGSSLITKKFSLSLSYTYGQKIRYLEAPYQGRGSDGSASATYFPSEKLRFALTLAYSDFTRSADGAKEYDYAIVRSVNIYQVNKYLFFRAIGEYNSFRKRIVTDFLASFTYIPGTVIYVGYGNAYEKIAWIDGASVPADRYRESRRGFFFKASYLWRL